MKNRKIYGGLIQRYANFHKACSRLIEVTEGNHVHFLDFYSSTESEVIFLIPGIGSPSLQDADCQISTWHGEGFLNQ
jgi:hypothetical protein